MTLKKRTQHPPTYKDYKKYKGPLRIDFEHRCAYCGIREAQDGGSKKFHIDHYKPKKKFPLEANNYSNLFYVCSDCNRSKWDYWPNPFQWLIGHFIINPCDHDVSEHYDITQSEWKGNTKAARWNIVRLRLNSSRKLNIREDEKVFLEMLVDLSQRESELKKIMLKNDLPLDERNIVESSLQKIQREKISLQRHFEPLE
jgi:hypothetical protein